MRCILVASSTFEFTSMNHWYKTTTSGDFAAVRGFDGRHQAVFFFYFFVYIQIWTPKFFAALTGAIFFRQASIKQSFSFFVPLQSAAGENFGRSSRKEWFLQLKITFQTKYFLNFFFHQLENVYIQIFATDSVYTGFEWGLRFRSCIYISVYIMNILILRSWVAVIFAIYSIPDI